MLWIIQDNLWQEKEYRKFVDIVKRSGIECTTITVVPFSHELIPPIKYPGKKIAYGSTTLMKISLAEGWDPGCYYNENFRFEQWVKNYKHHMLNSDAVVSKFKEVIPSDLFFIRPCEDLKQFTGEVIKKENFEEWRDRILKMDSVSTLCGDTMVMISEPKNIEMEFRFFIVNKQIATCSSYRAFNNLLTTLPVDSSAYAFVEEMIDIWTPHDVFVMDIARTNEGYKILEINCANAAGFYNCDVSKIVQKIYDFECGN